MHAIHPYNRFKEEDFEVTSATTLDEKLALGKAGWQKYDEASFNDITVHFYRKPKRFGGLRMLDDKKKCATIGFYVWLMCLWFATNGI